jgi:hypothetical protein
MFHDQRDFQQIEILPLALPIDSGQRETAPSEDSDLKKISENP